MKPETEQKFQLKLLDYLIALVIFCMVILESLHTIHQIGVSWDEPVYFSYAKAYTQWAIHIGEDGAWSREILEYVFNIGLFTTCSPTLNKILGALTYSAFKNTLGEFWAYRMYAPILFGLLVSLIFLRAIKEWGRLVGFASALLVFFMPRFFVEGHIGATETPLCFFWFMSVILFEAGFHRRWLAPLAGIAYGLTMSVKFTGFLLPIPLLLWAILYHRRKIFLPAICLLIIGPAVFLLLQPSMWDHPFSDLWEFIMMSLTRGQTAQIPVYFLGKYYSFSAPWYYAPVMVLVTVPELTLVFFALGIFNTFRNRFRDQFAVSCLIQFGFFILIMILPGSPTYDGVRLFIPAFIFLALVAGYGFKGVIKWFEKSGLKSLAQSALFLLLILGTILPLAKVYPYGLEYYNEFIGGVSGARNLGLETTYWWTVVNEKAISELNQVLPVNASIVFWPVNTKLGRFYQEIGLLRKDLRISHTNDHYSVASLKDGTIVILNENAGPHGKIKNPENDFEYLLMLSRPYWDYEPFFRSLGVRRSQLQVVASKSLDGVPLWVLYKR